MTHPLDTLVKRIAPVSDEQLPALDLSAGEAELRESLLRAAAADAPTAARAAVRTSGPRATRRGIRAAGLATALALVAAATGVTLTRDGSVTAGPERVWAAEAIRVADAVPRIAFDAPGWRVERADEFTVGDGEMTFTNGDVAVDLRWSRTAPESFKRDRDATQIPDVELLGRRATAVRYDAAEEGLGYTTVLWRDGGYALELRIDPITVGGPLPREQIEALLSHVRLVSVDAWLGAMPASAVLPDARRMEVERMLAGVPVPDGLDVQAVVDGDSVRDRYQLQAAVVGTVTCAWIERWVDARRAGDKRAAAEATAAMASWGDWQVMRDMGPDGGYTSVVRDYAEALAGDGTVLGGKRVTVEGSYRNAFACHR